MKYNVGNYVQSGTGIYQIAAALEGEQPMLKTLDGKLIGFSQNVIIEPLPITPELLGRLGFKIESHPDLQYFSFPVRNRKAKGLRQNFRLENGVLTSTIGLWFIEFEYIHQLQNLFESIEEKELVFIEEKSQA